MAGNWKDASKHRADQAIFLENLRGELEENQQEVRTAAAYHEQLGVGLDSFVNQAGPEDLQVSFFRENGFEFLPEWAGIRSPFLARSIYESGQVANLLTGMDFEIISRISAIYTFQEEFKGFMDPVVNRLLNMDMETTREQVLISIEIITSDIKNLEQEMDGNYGDLIAYLEGLE